MNKIITIILMLNLSFLSLGAKVTKINDADLVTYEVYDINNYEEVLKEFNLSYSDRVLETKYVILDDLNIMYAEKVDRLYTVYLYYLKNSNEVYVSHRRLRTSFKNNRTIIKKSLVKNIGLGDRSKLNKEFEDELKKRIKEARNNDIKLNLEKDLQFFTSNKNNNSEKILNMLITLKPSGIAWDADVVLYLDSAISEAINLKYDDKKIETDIEKKINEVLKYVALERVVQMKEEIDNNRNLKKRKELLESKSKYVK